MEKHEYGRIDILFRKLRDAGVAEDLIARIMDGADAIKKSTTAEKKADWMGECMSRMDSLLDAETRRQVRESCACCLGGKRLQLSKAIAKAGGTLAERVAKANETPYVFGDAVELRPDGRIVVRFAPEGLPSYRCVCLPKAKEPVSETYCYCCGGHIKHHLQIALGATLECEVQATALTTAGGKPCSFLYKIVE